MLLLQLTRIDLRGIFEQGFRLIVFLILLVNYALLFFMHFLMVRPMYNICGHEYFSVVSRWLFISSKPSNISSAYWEIRGCCYITNILDVTVIGFAVMFLVSGIVEYCLSRGTRSKLRSLELDGKDANETVSAPQSMARQRITRKDSFRRLIFRMSISLVTAVFATVNFFSIFAVFLLYYLVETSLSDEIRAAYKSSFYALKWQMIMYLILSFFFSGLLWSVQGIHKSQLQGIYDRLKRMETFRKMNASETKSMIV